MARKKLSAEEKAAKKAKAKEVKVANEAKETIVLDGNEQTFLNKNGERVKLMEFIKPEEFWNIETKRVEENSITINIRHFILYDAIKRLAKEAGIYFFDKNQVYSPTIENKDLYGFDVSVYCSAGLDTLPDPKGAAQCRHGFFRTTMLGEANNENTRTLSGRYKGTTAEKRGYVRAVINHLGLKNVYGQDELDGEKADPTPEGPKVPTPTEYKQLLESLKGEVNEIMNCTDQDALDLFGAKLKENLSKYSPTQIEYLRRLWDSKRSSLDPAKF